MESNHLIIFTSSAKAFLLGALFLSSAMAQEYNFTFYNGDVSQAPVVESKGTPLGKKPNLEALPQQSIQAPRVLEKEVKAEDNEKLIRTGLSFLGGYSQSRLSGSNGFVSEAKSKTLRAGLSFISSYDFNLDIEFLSNSVELSLDNKRDNFSGRIPGIQLGIRNNYWLTEELGLSLGGNLRGMKGEVSSFGQSYSYRSVGFGVNAGPTIKIGKAQLLLAYDYGLENLGLSGEENNALNSDQWFQSSTVKGTLTYRF